MRATSCSVTRTIVSACAISTTLYLLLGCFGALAPLDLSGADRVPLRPPVSHLGRCPPAGSPCRTQSLPQSTLLFLDRCGPGCPGRRAGQPAGLSFAAGADVLSVLVSNKGGKIWCGPVYGAGPGWCGPERKAEHDTAFEWKRGLSGTALSGTALSGTALRGRVAKQE